MAELMDHVRVLADQIGPRPVSTEEEHQTSLYVAQELTDSGFEVNVDEFATPTGTRWAYALAFVAVALGTVISGIGIFVPGIALSMFVVGIVLVAAGVFVYYTELNHNPFLSKMRAGGVSQNVVAKHVPASVARDTRSRKVVVVAHVDTVRAQPEAMPQLVQHAPLLRKILYYDMIALVAVVVVRALPLPWPDAIDLVLWIVSLIGSLYALAAAGCIVANRFMPYISGANDNASAVAVMLTVAKRLLDPDERAKAAERRAARAKAAAEELDAKLAAEDAQVEVHDAQAAAEAGVVPEGATVEYDGASSQQTTVLPPIDPETGLPALDAAAPAADAASAETQIMQPVKEQGDVQAAAETDEPAAAEDAAAATAESDEGAHSTYQPLSDELFAKTSEDAVQSNVVSIPAKPVDEIPPVAPVQPAPQPPTAPDPDDGLPSWYRAAKKKAAADLARKQQGEEEEGQGGYRSRFADVPLNTVPESEPEPVAAAPREEQPASAPSAAVAETAAPEASPEQAAVPQAAAAEPAAQVPVADQAAPEQATPEQATPAPAAPVVTPIEEPTSSDAIVDFGETIDELEEPEDDEGSVDIPDDELDELTPDLSGAFSFAPAVEQPEPKSGLFRGLTSRIPIIGSSDGATRGEQQRRDAERRAGIESIPSFGAGVDPRVPLANPDDYAALQAEPEAPAQPVADVAEEPAAPKRELKSKPDRRKPTARHITQEFQPTKAAPRDADATRVLDGMRQQAPVSSTYEDTPQAGADYADPFAPKTQAWDARATQDAAPHPSRSGQMPAVGSAGYDAYAASPANSSSFPALTGSFPALSGQMPVIDDSAFSSQASYDGEAGGYHPADSYTPSSDDFADSFLAPGTTGEINIPESRFHNAMDKFGGLFNRKKNKKNSKPNEFGEGDAEKWNDDDDFGWKGGAYYEGDDNVIDFPEGGHAEGGYPEGEYAYAQHRSNSPAFDAARARAAEIRDSVIAMNESEDIDKEVWFVALGASGAGNQGMKNFMELHASELRGALIINLEAVGSGEIKFVEQEGTGKSRRADRRLLGLVKKAAREVNGKDMKSTKLEWRDTDATPAMLAGMRALTIMGFDGVAPTGWHWTTDSMDIIEEDKLEYTTDVVLDIIENA